MGDIASLQRKIRNAKHDIHQIIEILISIDVDLYRQYKETQCRHVITRITQLAYGQMLFGVFFFALNMYFPFIERPTHLVLDIIDGCDAIGWLLIGFNGWYIHHLVWRSSNVTLFREADRKREALGRRSERNTNQTNTPIVIPTDDNVGVNQQ